MKKYLLLAVLFIGIPLGAIEKKPTMMIVPSDNWCEQRYYTQTFSNQGMQVSVPDYNLAFKEDTELGSVISKLGELLTERGYSIKDCEQEMKAISMRTAEDNETFSKTTGASIYETSLDILKRRTKSDIILQVNWQVHKSGNNKVLSFTFEAFDSYTSKRIATAQGMSQPSTDIVPVILENAIMQYIEKFDQQLTAWYQDIQLHGREIVMTIRCWDNWENDLETEFNGEELLDCIQYWLTNHAVDGNFNLSDATATMAQFEQIRIPLVDENNRATDARSFATLLRKYIQQQYQITAKVLVRGLGEANIILGEK